MFKSVGHARDELSEVQPFRVGLAPCGSRHLCVAGDARRGDVVVLAERRADIHRRLPLRDRVRFVAVVPVAQADANRIVVAVRDALPRGGSSMPRPMLRAHERIDIPSAPDQNVVADLGFTAPNPVHARRDRVGRVGMENDPRDRRPGGARVEVRGRSPRPRLGKDKGQRSLGGHSGVLLLERLKEVQGVGHERRDHHLHIVSAQ